MAIYCASGRSSLRAATARLTADGVISCEEAGEIAKVIEGYMRSTDVVAALMHRIEQLEAIIVTASAILPHKPGAAIGAEIRSNGAAAG